MLWDPLETERMRLPQLGGAPSRVFEAVAGGERDTGGAGAQVMGVEDPIVAGRHTTPAQRNRKCRGVTRNETVLYSIHNKTSS